VEADRVAADVLRDSDHKFEPKLKDEGGVLSEDQIVKYKQVLANWPPTKELLIEVLSGPEKLSSLYRKAKYVLRKDKLMLVVLVDDASKHAAIVFSSRTDESCMQNRIDYVLAASTEIGFYNQFVDVLKGLPRVVKEMQCHIPYDDYSRWTWGYIISRFMMVCVIVGLLAVICDTDEFLLDSKNYSKGQNRNSASRGKSSIAGEQGGKQLRQRRRQTDLPPLHNDSKK